MKENNRFYSFRLRKIFLRKNKKNQSFFYFFLCFIFLFKEKNHTFANRKKRKKNVKIEKRNNI